MKKSANKSGNKSMDKSVDETIAAKENKLRGILKDWGSVAVAFSGGVDSTYLLKVAHDTLGERAVAVTADSVFVPRREAEAAKAFCQAEAIEQISLNFTPLQEPEIRANPAHRCYLCKKHIFGAIKELAARRGLSTVAEGSNLDDNADYRPGMKALRELSIKSPLQEAGLAKSEIRLLAKRLNLTVWQKPSAACLASRIPYGEELTAAKLSLAERGEDYLREQGFSVVRLRLHEGGKLARLEILPEDFPRLTERLRLDLTEKLRSLGCHYVTLDLLGYRAGSLNEILPAST